MVVSSFLLRVCAQTATFAPGMTFVMKVFARGKILQFVKMEIHALWAFVSPIKAAYST